MSQSSNTASTTSSTISATQSLSVPIGKNLSSSSLRTLIPSVGKIAYDSGDAHLYVGTTSGWVQIANSP